MKNHIISLLAYNDTANHKLLAAILQLPDPTEALRLFSHLIATQDKWMNRITKAAEDSSYSWYGTEYDAVNITEEWRRSIVAWVELANTTTDAELNNDIFFSRPADGKQMMIQMQDLMLQINYHIMHHRAQINKLISAQNVPVPNTDYIHTVLRIEADKKEVNP